MPLAKANQLFLGRPSTAVRVNMKGVKGVHEVHEHRPQSAAFLVLSMRLCDKRSHTRLRQCPEELPSYTTYNTSQVTVSNRAESVVAASSRQHPYTSCLV